MKAGDKIFLKNHSEISGTHTIQEYEINNKVFFHVNKIPITSPEGEPWDIVCLIRGENGVNTYEATWKRESVSLDKFKEEI